uniref:Uncharacterized protein n=1 Tax=Steinernema glaseri TaxID=37863 RepID=A0A1I7ZKL2_9BILA
MSPLSSSLDRQLSFRRDSRKEPGEEGNTCGSIYKTGRAPGTPLPGTFDQEAGKRSVVPESYRHAIADFVNHATGLMRAVVLDRLPCPRLFYRFLSASYH